MSTPTQIQGTNPSGRERFLQDYREGIRNALTNSMNNRIYQYLQCQTTETKFKTIATDFDINEYALADRLQTLEHALLINRQYQIVGDTVTTVFEARNLRDCGEQIVAEITDNKTADSNPD